MSKAAQVKAPWLNSRDPEVPATLTYSDAVHVQPGGGDGAPLSRLHRL